MDNFILEDKVQFSNLNMNQPLDMKLPSETVYLMINFRFKNSYILKRN